MNTYFPVNLNTTLVTVDTSVISSTKFVVIPPNDPSPDLDSKGRLLYFKEITGIPNVSQFHVTWLSSSTVQQITLSSLQCLSLFEFPADYYNPLHLYNGSLSSFGTRPSSSVIVNAPRNKTVLFVNLQTQSKTLVLPPIAELTENLKSPYYTVKDTNGFANTSTLFISTTGNALIDGLGTTLSINENFASVELVGDHSRNEWHILNYFIPPILPLQAVAIYDFNFYTQSNASVANQVPGSPIGSATIHLPGSNTYVQTDPLNKHLIIFGPNNNLGPTSGITTPSISGVFSTEMWVRLDVSLGYGTFFVDFREGLNSGFMVQGSFGDGNVGAAFVGQSIYFNAVRSTITAITNPLAVIFQGGWFQVVIVTSTSFVDDLTFFSRFTQAQGCPLSVAEVSIYNRVLTNADILTLYNTKRGRYGPPGPSPAPAPAPAPAPDPDPYPDPKDF